MSVYSPHALPSNQQARHNLSSLTVWAPPPPLRHSACLLYTSLRNAALCGPICARNVHNLPVAALTAVCLLTLRAAHPCNFNVTDGIELLCYHEEQPAALVCSLHTHSVHKTFCSYNLAVSEGVQSGLAYLLLYVYACSLLCRDSDKILHNKATRCAPFWDITQRRVVIHRRRFGKNYRSHLQVSRNLVFLKSLIERSAVDGRDYEV